MKHIVFLILPLYIPLYKLQHSAPEYFQNFVYRLISTFMYVWRKRCSVL